MPPTELQLAPHAAIKRHPALAYFLLTFALSWLAALAIAAPFLLRHQGLPKLVGILMFPVMLLGPLACGLLLTRIVDGKLALRSLLRSMISAGFNWRWYATLLLPPLLILALLLAMQRLVSPAFAPNHFLLGLLFGIPAGLFEEIGWTGFAFPKLRSYRSALAAAALLGVLWGLWHLPVIDFLGAATPHGRWLVPFFLSFILAMTAMRVLIAWIYTNTHSLLLAQLMHISSTGALVVFSPPLASAAQEALWYALYGLLLWTIVGIVVAIFGKRLAR